MKADYRGLAPASRRASTALRGASRKRDTACEVRLRKELWRRGLRYQVDVKDLPGRPDIVFVKQRVAVFCDGDFWHGRGLRERLQRLQAGHNAHYWTAKILGNVRRDRRIKSELRAAGWTVVRVWETDIRVNVSKQADKIEALLRPRGN